MAAHLLTTSSTIACQHGGSAHLSTENTRVLADGALVLLESDIHLVTGCSLNSPCVRIEWTAGATRSTIKGTALLVQTSVGKCLSAGGTPQGVAIICGTQGRVAAQ